MAQAREAWKANQADLNPDKLVFIDETGASTKMVRLRGRCRRGQRLLAKAPFGHWKTTTFTAGLRREGLVAPFVLDGPMNGEAFLVYVEKILVPALRPDEIVVMDNLPAHKVAGVRKLPARGYRNLARETDKCASAAACGRSAGRNGRPPPPGGTICGYEVSPSATSASGAAAARDRPPSRAPSPRRGPAQRLLGTPSA